MVIPALPSCPTFVQAHLDPARQIFDVQTQEDDQRAKPYDEGECEHAEGLVRCSSDHQIITYPSVAVCLRRKDIVGLRSNLTSIILHKYTLELRHCNRVPVICFDLPLVWW